MDDIINRFNPLSNPVFPEIRIFLKTLYQKIHADLLTDFQKMFVQNLHGLPGTVFFLKIPDYL